MRTLLAASLTDEQREVVKVCMEIAREFRKGWLVNAKDAKTPESRRYYETRSRGANDVERNIYVRLLWRKS